MNAIDYSLEAAQSDVDGYRYSDVGTLGDDLEHAHLTCSYDAVKKWGRSVGIVGIRPFPSFEAAAEALKREELSAVVVPAAYPRLGSLIYDSALMVRESFLMKIPNMVLAGLAPLAPNYVHSLYHHPATAPLLKEVPFRVVETRAVSSNSKACMALLSDPQPAAVITNALCASFYELKVYRVLRVGIRMPFIVFVRSI